jgi:DNA-binding NarL/FixJ family response regulator
LAQPATSAAPSRKFWLDRTSCQQLPTRPKHAIETLSDSPVDIVVSDIDLKGRADGVGLARWLLQHQPETAIILLADTFPWFPAHSPVAAIPVLMRPVDTRILLQKIRDAVPTMETRDVV